jgi:NAD(P)-dependent dehydrogenase (short-subunit alcohol dehydrogenase family)
MAGGLEGKIAIVTGGNSGIGEATVHRFAREGARVAILARREEEGLAVERAVREAGADATFIRCDVTELADIESAVAKTVNLYGGVHVLVNNAGGGGGRAPDPFPEPGGDDAFEYTLRLNLTSVYQMTRAAWPHLKAGGGGSIVNVSSLAAVAAYSSAMWELLPGGMSPPPAYFAAKAGVEALTRLTASVGVLHNIRANVVRPGAILTPGVQRMSPGHHRLEKLHEFIQMTPGVGDADDIANAIYFLASDESKFVNAQVLAVDGGAVHKVS